LAGIVILAINPNKQLGNANDTERQAEINTILNAVYQYAIDNNGVLPEDTDGESIATTAKMLGESGGSCSGICDAVTTDADCIDLSGPLVPDYLVDMPIAPDEDADEDTTGYYIELIAGNRIEVGACETNEAGEIMIQR